MSVKSKSINPMMIPEDYEEFCGEEMKPFVALKEEEERKAAALLAQQDAAAGKQAVEPAPQDPKEVARRRFAFRSWLNGLFSASL